jgi:hypothetical protein
MRKIAPIAEKIIQFIKKSFISLHHRGQLMVHHSIRRR